MSQQRTPLSSRVAAEENTADRPAVIADEHKNARILQEQHDGSQVHMHAPEDDGDLDALLAVLARIVVRVATHDAATAASQPTVVSA